MQTEAQSLQLDPAVSSKRPSEDTNNNPKKKIVPRVGDAGVMQTEPQSLQLDPAVSSKRPSEDANNNPKKKKRKKKRKRKQSDGESLGPSSLSSNQSDVPPADVKKRVDEKDRSSDSEGSPQDHALSSMDPPPSVSVRSDEPSEKLRPKASKKANASPDDHPEDQPNQEEPEPEETPDLRKHHGDAEHQTSQESPVQPHKAPESKDDPNKQSEQKMVFGPQSQAEETSKNVPKNQSTQKSQTADVKKNLEQTAAKEKPSGSFPKRRSAPPQNISSTDRLTIYFHAVLSKDFKFNPDEDVITIRAGGRLGNWDSDLMELSVSRDLEDHGFLVEGKLACKKSVALAVSIPYKYVIYKQSKQHYEFIYKSDAAGHINRCLFVKEGLLNDEGEWHQYDDVICKQPSQNVIRRLWEYWSKHKTDIIQGRGIAGRFMLETIFDLLRSWSSTNLRNFLHQLQQFHEVYANPYVYETTPVKWSSLDYGEKDVRKLLSKFLHERVTPDLQRERESEKPGAFLNEPLKAALIVLHVWSKYRLELDHAITSRLCLALCLPKMPEEEFLPLWTDIRSSFSSVDLLTKALEDWIRKVRSRNMPHWILLIPLLHLLRGTSTPFQPVSNRLSIRYVKTWAGLVGLMDAPHSFTSQEERAMLNLMKTHAHLVEVDRLLPRSWTFLLSLDRLADCSAAIGVELLDILLLLGAKCPEEINFNSSSGVSETLAHIRSQLLEQKYRCPSEDYGVQCLQAVCNLLTKICSAVRYHHYGQNHTDIPIACLNLVATVSEFIQGAGEKTLALLAEVKQTLRDWIQRNFKDKLLRCSLMSLSFTPEIQIWNDIIITDFMNPDFTQEWRQTFTRDFEGKFQQEDNFDQIQVFCSKMEDLNVSGHLVASVEKCALQAVTAVCQSKSEARLFERLNSYHVNWKLGQLVSTIILKSWPKDRSGSSLQGEGDVLKHVLGWTAAKTVFELYGTDLIDQLSHEAKEMFITATSLLIDVRNRLEGGNIKMKLLKTLLEKRSVFLELLAIECFRRDERGGEVRRLLQARQEEVTAVYHERTLVDALVRMCRCLQEHLTVDIECLEKQLKVNIEEMELDEFLDVRSLDELDLSTPPCVAYFNLAGDVRSMAEHLDTFKDSYVFKMLWSKEARTFAEALSLSCDVDEELIDLDELDSDVFQPCFTAYHSICTDLKEGCISFEKVDEIFKDFMGKYQELAVEFGIVSKLHRFKDQSWIPARVQQIEQYHQLHLAVESAKVVMEVKQTLVLQGNFRVVENLLETTHLEFKKERLDRIDSDMMLAKSVLEDISDSRRPCLRELALRKNLVVWVKEALRDINELKVFVDLASISAGENDLDVDRVACFHDAILGYSSMLYDLKPDAGFKELKEMLKKLWKALDNDPNLPKKLRDSARHIEWLKTVKDSHGSVELSSLSLASAINTNGVYTISAEDQKKVCLENILKLHIREEHDEVLEMRVCSLDDLRDLQNKLMLMSGKGDQGQSEVDQFTEVFASAQRLACAFVDLHVAGNPFFRDWKARINCQAECIVFDFTLNGVEREISVPGDVTEQLPQLCKKMENCLDLWKAFMDRQRSQHYYLNYFTAEQLVYLCSQLTPQKCDVDSRVFMMLSFIKPDCSAADLRQAWHKYQYGVIKSSPLNDSLEFQMSANGCAEDVPLMFCSLDDRLAEASGPGKLDVVWNTYMQDMSSFLPSTLDVRRLGRFLEMLANSLTEKSVSPLVKKHQCVQRILPTGMDSGRPNLIICPSAEILMSCVSVYMCSPTEPLPTYDEVLLCNADTPFEEVELFLRRCLSEGYGGHKIYTMLYVDQLSYEVSYRVEQFFRCQSPRSRPDYSLVLFCSSGREHAYLPSAFSEFRLNMVPQELLRDVQDYLARHFTVPVDVSSAAASFRNRLSVGLVSSQRAGVGKSLYVKRIFEKLRTITRRPSRLKSIRLIEPNINENAVLQNLLMSSNTEQLTVYHFDVTTTVKKGLHEFLFKLLVLGYLMDTEGNMWRSSRTHLYIIEVLRSSISQKANDVPSAFLNVFPTVHCRPPKEVFELEMRIQEGCPSTGQDPLMDDLEFRSEAYQRPYQYLKRFNSRENLDGFLYQGVEGTHVECLQILFVYCGILDPSWAELRNFTWFLNLQLQDCENSVFCDVNFTGDTLFGFKNFVVDFMIMMAKDFATPSLCISDQSPGRRLNDLSTANEDDLAPFKIRKQWESEPHPYIFFNDDHVSMTFIGFHLQPNAENMIDAIDPSTRRVIRKNIMTVQLYEGLILQRVPFNMDFDQLPRWEKIERLSRVLGIQWPLDPDETYELTTDNILKMLAINMRFRCRIPVIIMGETGCGKTRLVKFLCELRRGGVATDNMKLVKVHGGTSSNMIYNKLREAETMATENKRDYGFDSVLFFDEANTTEAISCIKEVLCDNTADGQILTPNSGLQIIAACNPYRKHTDVMIERLESAGLGYKVHAEETDEKLGSIPLRQLVYRVQALPPSMIPFVWDFGQLNDHTEAMYIKQIVERVGKTHLIDLCDITTITDVLSASQKYMRTRKDECSFVSLRDVERCMLVFDWFCKNGMMIISELERFEESQGASTTERDIVLWALIMAVSVCYHACLENKEKYRTTICRYLPETHSSAKVLQEISLIQDLFLSGVPLGETIARNKALKENVFMMVICIELRIPLFLVGKPGSSKSLSKTLVADGMQGQASHSDLFRKLKQIHLVSFQCSPHSTPEGIINTFKQCARFQEGKNLSEYVSVVVLDEIGLAEDSVKMPLKTLHPLLEEGCIDDQALPHKKVGFIGISNWALDPAKMNRGIFVSRGDPDEKELIESAKGICSSDAMLLERVRHNFQPFAYAYMKICKKQGKGFFGLRDYYSLIKMLFAVAKSSHQNPNSEQILKAVLRNFSGHDNVNAVAFFTKSLNIQAEICNISAIELVRENIMDIGQDEECRYLLVLTKNYAALRILQQMFFSKMSQPEIIFGSGFPKDQEYTQICRNINRVKICMETGQTIVLLNLQNLYESLYDALNQYYVCLGGQKYVDLGLGTHRVKCRVHSDFRLIVIEEKSVVYKQFPIPLINRLEKHYLDINTVLKNDQKDLVEKLEQWVKLFVGVQGMHLNSRKYRPEDSFIGYHSDTCGSVVLQVTELLKEQAELSDSRERILDEAKLTLLNCATPDAVVRLDYTALSNVESEHLSKVFFEEQRHSCLGDFILHHIEHSGHRQTFFTEVTTFSRLLTAAETEQLHSAIQNVQLLSLQQFDTEHSFLKKIRKYLDSTSGDKLIIIQTDFAESFRSLNVMASAKYSSNNEINKIRTKENEKIFVYFITKLMRMDSGTSYVGFHGSPWKSVHIDDLRRSKDMVSDIKALQNVTISQLFDTDKPEAMEVEDMYLGEEAKAGKESWENVLDTTALLRCCVQSAVSMLSDQTGTRSTRRVEILLMQLTDSNGLQASFLKILKRRLHSLLSIQEENLPAAKNWVVREALNIDALQEGGTFRHSLWRRVQAAVRPFMAQILSFIDRDCNLDLLLDGELLQKLWLDIFGDEKLLFIACTGTNNNTASKMIMVQNYIDKGCSLPFSWRIKDYLEELWEHTLQREGHSVQQFEDFFWQTPLGRYVSDADQDTQLEIFHRYLQDFISMTMNVRSWEHLKLLCGALSCGVNELQASLGTNETGLSLPWVHVAYHHFKNRIQNLYRMISIQPQVAEVLLTNPSALQGEELVLDLYAALACVEFLEPQTLDGELESQAWLRLVKMLQMPVELACCEENQSLLKEKSRQLVTCIQRGWCRIHCQALFVEHMLLGMEELPPRLRPLVVEHTRRLGLVLEQDSDLRMKRPFEAVITVLRACKDGASGRIFRFGVQPCPVCLGDPQDPLSLPCDHIFCLACIKKWLVPGQMFCPLCIQEVPGDFELKISEEIRGIVDQHASFRKRCNAFFLDLVSSLCFKDNTPPSRDVVLHLLSLLMVEASSVPQIRGQDQCFLTKALSPFNDSLDRNPVVRSVVLKLLLKYSFEDVKDYLQQHLTQVEQSNIMEETDKTELYCLYVNCLEDSMCERKRPLRVETEFLQEFLRSDDVSADTPTVEYLQKLARLRLCLDLASDPLVLHAGSSGQGSDVHSAFLGGVVALCQRSGNDWYRVYLIRRICSLHGVEFVQALLPRPEFAWLFPREILQSENQDDSQIDQYLACGDDYKRIRDALGEAVLHGDLSKIQDAIKSCSCSPVKQTAFLLLALFKEVTTLYRADNPSMHPNPKLCSGLDDFIRSSETLHSDALKAFAGALVRNELRACPRASSADHALLEAAVHMAAVVLSADAPLLQPLQQMALTPRHMRASFIPTMPDDMLIVAQNALGPVQWYLCRNNHHCTVGECGLPMQKSVCPECGAEIGGVEHRPVEGFTRMQPQGDRTRRGHVLGEARRHDQPDMQDTKDMSPVVFTLLRLLTHLSLLLGSLKEPQSLVEMIAPAVEDPRAFLSAHLMKDVEQLSRTLGKGMDETICAVHLTLHSLMDTPGLNSDPPDHTLSTKEARNQWESVMSAEVITPQLKRLDAEIQRVNAVIRADERVSSNPVLKLLFGEPALFLAALPQRSLIHTSTFWSCRTKLSMRSLAHVVEQNDGRDSLPVLWRFLQREAELRLVRFLPDILVLHKSLVKKFQNVPDVQSETTIAEFLQSQKSVSLRAWLEKHVQIFLTTWNHLRTSLANSGEIKLPAEFTQTDLDLGADVRVLLPRRRGLGLCSTALVSYLIALQNDLIYTAEKHTGDQSGYTVSPADLMELHVIRYEYERDLLPLLLSHCQYRVERGQETLLEYDLAQIQQQILKRFLQGKPRLTVNGIPTLLNRQDRNYELLLADVKAKVCQECVAPLTQCAVLKDLQAYTDVCETLSTLELALGFLAMTGGDPLMPLHTYLQEALHMTEQITPHVLQVLSRCSLKHCVSLWQLLASLKSEAMLRLKADPFASISTSYRAPLPDAIKTPLTAFLSKSSSHAFLLEMHEFLMLLLKNPTNKDTFRPDWSLKQTLLAYMERKGLDVPQEVEDFFPEDVLLAHYTSTWSFCVLSRDQRHQ